MQVKDRKVRQLALLALFYRAKWQVFLPFPILQLGKPLPFYILGRTFQAEPPRIDPRREYPPPPPWLSVTVLKIQVITVPLLFCSIHFWKRSEVVQRQKYRNLSPEGRPESCYAYFSCKNFYYSVISNWCDKFVSVFVAIGAKSSGKSQLLFFTYFLVVKLVRKYSQFLFTNLSFIKLKNYMTLYIFIL